MENSGEYETCIEIIEENHNNCTPNKCLMKIINPSNSEKEQNVENDTKFCLANFCVKCGINMGDCNPRQLCGKIYCYEE